MHFSPGIVYQLSKGTLEACIVCQEYFTTGFLVCSPACADAQLDSSPLVRLQEDHRAFADVLARFRNRWDPSNSAPTVTDIYAILSSARSNKAYLDYRWKIERKSKCIAAGFRPGNERLRWHGTSSNCDITKIGDGLCSSSNSCNLCDIIRGSFKTQKCLGGLYGTGIYTSSIPVKAHGYALTGGRGNALLLNSVVTGHPKLLTAHDSSLTRAPWNRDSVWVTPQGGPVKYDEVVVYDDAAIRPVFLIVYE